MMTKEKGVKVTFGPVARYAQGLRVNVLCDARAIGHLYRSRGAGAWAGSNGVDMVFGDSALDKGSLVEVNEEAQRLAKGITLRTCRNCEEAYSTLSGDDEERCHWGLDETRLVVEG